MQCQAQIDTVFHFLRVWQNRNMDTDTIDGLMLRTISERGGNATIAQLAGAVAWTRLRDVQSSLRRLAKSGRVELAGDSYALTPAGRRIVAAWRAPDRPPAWRTTTYRPPVVVRRPGSDDWRACPSIMSGEARPWRSP